MSVQERAKDVIVAKGEDVRGQWALVVSARVLEAQPRDPLT